MFDRHFIATWFLAGWLPILACALWLTSGDERKSTVVAVIVAGYAVQAMQISIFGKKAFEWLAIARD